MKYFIVAAVFLCTGVFAQQGDGPFANVGECIDKAVANTTGALKSTIKGIGECIAKQNKVDSLTDSVDKFISAFTDVTEELSAISKCTNDFSCYVETIKAAVATGFEILELIENFVKDLNSVTTDSVLRACITDQLNVTREAVEAGWECFDFYNFF